MTFEKDANLSRSAPEQPKFAAKTKNGSDSKYTKKHMEAGLTALNAFFNTHNTVDKNILAALYMQSFNTWAQGGNFTLSSSIKHMRDFTSFLQASSGNIQKVGISYDIDAKHDAK